jgi:hypothetical protein
MIVNGNEEKKNEHWAAMLSESRSYALANSGGHDSTARTS